MASYVIALLFVLGPIADILTNVWPWQFGNEQWRFGLVGVASNYLVSLIFGLLLWALVAAQCEHRTALRVITAVAAAGTLVLLVISVGFALDTIQLRNFVREEQRPLFKIGAVKTALKVLTSMLAMLLVAIGSFKAARHLGRGR